MHARTTALVLAGFAAALLRPATTVHAPSANQPLAQEDDPPVVQEDEPGPHGGLLGVSAARRRTLMEGLPGNWRLTDFAHSTNNLADVPIFGFMSIQKNGYLNFIVHTREPDTFVFEDNLRVQAGVHHWRLSPQGFLQTSSILAHTNFSGDLVVEQAYSPREYDVTLMGTTLILRRPDETQLFFERLGEATFPAEAVRRIEVLREGRATPEGF